MAGSPGFVYRVRLDGTGIRKALEQTILALWGVSPDGRWIGAWASLPGNGPPSSQAFPLDGNPPIALGWVPFGWSKPGWQPRGMELVPLFSKWTYTLPLAPGQILPPIPPGGFHSDDQIASLPGARRGPPWPVAFGPGDVYAYYRESIQRNLYRIPIP